MLRADGTVGAYHRHGRPGNRSTAVGQQPFVVVESVGELSLQATFGREGFFESLARCDESYRMNEGRANAGAASSVLGTTGYVFGAIVSPLVGYGNIMHSTALVFGVVTCIVLISAFMARSLPPDIDS